VSAAWPGGEGPNGPPRIRASAKRSNAGHLVSCSAETIPDRLGFLLHRAARVPRARAVLLSRGKRRPPRRDQRAGAAILKEALNAYPTRTSQASKRSAGRAQWICGTTRRGGLATRHLQLARETGALTELPLALDGLSAACTFAGEPAEAASLIDPHWGLGELIVAAFRSGKTERRRMRSSGSRR
jgi:hypothetical protein